MKKILTIISVAAAMLVSVNSNAQSQWGFGGGFISGSFTGKDNPDLKSFPGFYLGIDRNWAFSSLEGLSLDPGVNFVYMSKDKKRLPSIQIPVNIKYSFELAPDFTFSAFTGPVFNFGMTSNGYSKDDLIYGGRLKKWNAQWDLGAEITYSQSISLRIGYNFGMTKAFHLDGEDPKIRFNGFQIGLVFHVME